MVVQVKGLPDKKNYQPVSVSSTSASATDLQSQSMPVFPSRNIQTTAKSCLKLLLINLMRLWRWFSSFAIIIFFAAFLIGGILPYVVTFVAIMSLGYHFSDSLLYQPETPAESRLLVLSPQLYSLPFEAVSIQTKDRVKLHAYLIKQDHSNSRQLATIVYLHGNAGNIGHRLENARLLYQKLNCNLLLVEYRGYGRSEGSPSESGFYLDAQAAFEYVESREDLDSNKIILFGRSLGAAVCIDLAARCDYRDRIKAVIAENTFTSIPDLAQKLFPFRFIRWIPTLYYKNQFMTYQKMSSVVSPILFISGTKDELIPPAMMSNLYDRCSSSLKRLIRFPGGHNDTWTCKDYCDQVAVFVNEALAQPKEPQFTPYADNIV